MTWLTWTSSYGSGCSSDGSTPPALHRLNHSVDPRHHDPNSGGLLIIRDGLFGTYAAPEAIAAYGVDGAPDGARGPVEAHLRPYRMLARRVAAATGWRAKLRLL